MESSIDPCPGYCTLFLIKMIFGQGVACPLTVVHGAWIGVGSYVGKITVR